MFFARQLFEDEMKAMFEEQHKRVADKIRALFNEHHNPDEEAVLEMKYHHRSPKGNLIYHGIGISNSKNTLYHIRIAVNPLTGEVGPVEESTEDIDWNAWGIPEVDEPFRRD